MQQIFEFHSGSCFVSLAGVQLLCLYLVDSHDGERPVYLQDAEPDPGEKRVDQHERDGERHPAGVA